MGMCVNYQYLRFKETLCLIGVFQWEHVFRVDEKSVYVNVNYLIKAVVKSAGNFIKRHGVVYIHHVKTVLFEVRFTRDCQKVNIIS